MFGYQRVFFTIIKIALRVKGEFYLFSYNAIVKDRVLFKQTRSSIEIFLNFVEKYVSEKEKVTVIVTIIIEYA